jgi:hypothetical protein
MNVDDVRKLKFDRRMERRRGWLEPGELEAHLETLPDAEGKIHEHTEEEIAELSGANDGEAAAPEPNPA